ncbi:MAG: hypothetical protein ACSHWR_07980 [Psychromonas sp.]
MPNTIEIYFNKIGNSQFPPEVSSEEEIKLFRKDNRHIMANFIPNGVPFVLRDYSQTVNKEKTWQESNPDLATKFRELLLLPHEQRINIATMLDQYGAHMLTATAEFYETELALLKISDKFNPQEPSNLNGYAGALVGIAENRLTAFGKLVTEYQKVLESIRNASLNKASKAEILKLEQRATNLNKTLNIRFKSEITKYFNKAGQKGSAWTNVQRGINQAKSGRLRSQVDLTSHNNFRLLKNYTKIAKGTGIIGIGVDAAFRGASVYDKYQTGGNWQRSAAIETAAFGAAGAGGVFLGGQAVSWALGLTLAATPLGWVILIGAGLTAGYIGAVGGDFIGRELATGAYNASSKRLSL